MTYRGRFAPSPSGALHFGSLVAAVGSYLDAKHQQGQWLLRMEDLDTPRNIAGAADDILRTLERYGLHWDESVVYQSQRISLYQAALESLLQRNLAYPCTCSRKTVVAQNGERVYHGHCRQHPADLHHPHAWRLTVNQASITFQDSLQGKQSQSLTDEVGDFVLKRMDGIFAYQLAVVVDDAAQQISHVVRGADLLDSTPRQIYLQQQLQLPTPQYLHLPIAVNTQGEKLSKQTLATPINAADPVAMLHQVLIFLRQSPPATLSTAPINELWTWAISHWQPATMRNCLHQPDPSTS